MDFYQARNNFYEAASLGLESEILWEDEKQYNLATLIKTDILHRAAQGLDLLKVSLEVRDHYLDIISTRVKSKHTGSWWQRNYKRKHNCSFSELCEAYYNNQEKMRPVHTWFLGEAHLRLFYAVQRI